MQLLLPLPQRVASVFRDVISDGVIKKIYILEYYGNIFIRLSSLYSFTSGSLPESLRPVYILVNLADHRQSAGFSAAGRSHYCSGASLPDLDGNAHPGSHVTIRETTFLNPTDASSGRISPPPCIHRQVSSLEFAFRMDSQASAGLSDIFPCISSPGYTKEGSDQHQDTSGKIQASTVIKYGHICYRQRRAKYLAEAHFRRILIHGVTDPVRASAFCSCHPPPWLLPDRYLPDHRISTRSCPHIFQK